MEPKISIAIDGPAGAGKSTIAKNVANHFKIIYLDTGAMYRTLALKMVREGIDLTDRKRISQIVKNINMDILFNKGEQRMFLDNEDVSEFIRDSKISLGASKVSAIPEVRIKMAQMQRKFASENSLVMEGRDIGTYVIPNADIKIFLTASIGERAKRRYKQLTVNKERDSSLEDIIKEIEYRDKNDSSRDLAPLKKAEDAIEIDTTNMSIEQVTGKIIDCIRRMGVWKN